MPPRRSNWKKAGEEAPAPVAPPAVDDDDDEKMEDDQTKDAIPTEQTHPAAVQAQQQQEQMTQLEIWDRENERDWTHLSNANEDELLRTTRAHSTELFLGGVPKSATVEDVENQLFNKNEGTEEACPARPIECELVKDPTDETRNKGYAFAKFADRESCKMVCEYFASGGETRSVVEVVDSTTNETTRKKIRAMIKPTKHVLYVNGIERDATREQIVEELMRVGGGGIEKLYLPRAPRTGTNGIATKHKGYGFVDYFNQKTAERAMRNINANKVLNRQCLAKWADVNARLPSKEDLMAQSKSVYVGQIPAEGIALDEKDLEAKLREVFETFGTVEAVKFPNKGDITKGYAFVHFAERSSAEKAVEAATVSSANRENKEVSAMDDSSNGVQLQGCALTVDIARPEKQSVNNSNNNRGRGGRMGVGGRRRGGDYISPMGGGIAPRMTGGGNQMTPVYLPNGQTAFVMGQGNMPAPNVGWGRQNVIDRLGDRGDRRGDFRGRSRDYDDYDGRRGTGGRRRSRRDDSRDRGYDGRDRHGACPY